MSTRLPEATDSESWDLRRFCIPRNTRLSCFWKNDPSFTSSPTGKYHSPNVIPWRYRSARTWGISYLEAAAQKFGKNISFFSTSLHEGRGFSPLILSLTWKVWAVFRKLQLDVNWRWIRFVSFFTSRDLSCGCFIFKFLLFSLTVLLPGVSHSRFFVSPRMLWHASRCPSRKEDRSENLGGSDSNGKQSLKASECPCGPRRRRYGRGRRKSTHV